MTTKLYHRKYKHKWLFFNVHFYLKISHNLGLPNSLFKPLSFFSHYLIKPIILMNTRMVPYIYRFMSLSFAIPQTVYNQVLLLYYRYPKKNTSECLCNKSHKRVHTKAAIIRLLLNWCLIVFHFPSHRKGFLGILYTPTIYNL